MRTKKEIDAMIEYVEDKLLEIPKETSVRKYNRFSGQLQMLKWMLEESELPKPEDIPPGWEKEPFDVKYHDEEPDNEKETSDNRDTTRT